MPRVKQPDPACPCEVHWSPSYTPNADSLPGGKCGRLGRYVVVISIPGARPAIVPACTAHAKTLSAEMRRRRVAAVVWYRLKTRCELYWKVW